MNERIKELMVEAGIYECDDFEPHPTFEKFAELIVKECLKIVEPDQTSGDEWCVTLKGAAQEIREHFGVEL